MEHSQHDKLFTRALRMLQILSEDKKVHIDTLVEEFGVNRRTIYRDIKRLHFFPIELQNGYILVPDGFSIEHANLDEDELLIIELAFNSIDTMDKKVQKKISAIRAKLSNPLFFTPYGIKAEAFEKIDMNSELLNKMEDAIKKHNIATVVSHHDIVSIVEPYKIVAFDGFWYLLAKDRSDMKIKTYMLSHIKNFRASLETYSVSESDIDQLLENVHTAWFEDGNQFDVEIKVSKEIADYFKLKKHLPSQEIISKLDNGTLIIKFCVSSDEDIDNLIKAWLPHIEVLKPLRFREKIIQELEEYLQSMKNS